jgi:hypothetical protein
MHPRARRNTMQSRLSKLALSSLWVIALTVVAAAQEQPARTSVASLPNPATIDGSGAERSRPTGAPDIRVLIADPAIKSFIGLAENSYNFTDPNDVPGFEPMPLGNSSE